ncbi:phage tail tube protein [Paracoccus sp. (in: a-proteobacteria)]|uniref:phage tail tube protein n=1 Tax=Paracoccus sp. TaxID=267 RepID=UPI00272C53E2|nr:phage tail tube protein [Paracoccus sp. (in: a-proteobacteria)]
MARYAQRLIREKIETTPGTPVATAATDAIMARNVTLRNLEAEYQARDFAVGIEGAQGEDVYNIHAGAEYDIEAAPPATAGQPPLYGHLLRSSGFAQAIDDGDIVFTPLPEGQVIPTTTLQLRNGALMQNVAGCRGSVAFTAETGRKPFFRFNRRGRYAAPVAFTPEAHDFSGWPRALTCTPENMFAHTLGGVTLPVRSFSWNDGRQPRVDTYMNLEGTTLGPRNVTGSMTVRWPDLAAKDLLAAIRSGVTEPLVWTLGRDAGTVLTISAPQVQIKFAGEQDIEGDLGVTLDLVFLPTAAGNDDIEIRFS